MKRTEPQSIAQIMQEAMAAIGQSDNFAAARLCELWPEIVGPGINRMTTRRFVSRGVLHVYLTSAVMKQELQFGRERLVEQLNQAVGSNVITDIKFH